ncbi:MAG: DUF262 domain-containing protein [Polyangiaceae bacterium]|nr:DUF262 domain-containing protein [Polyangiaceae bacterium]
MSTKGLSIAASPVKVRDLVSKRRLDQIHVPDLQRGFVWDKQRVRELFDSLYRSYPVGSLLLWKPTWKAGETPVNVRPWDLCEPDQSTGKGVRAQPAKPSPGDVFVLDGQQRLTSLFRVIFDCREPDSTKPDPPLLVSLSRSAEWAEAPFLYRSRNLRREREREGLVVQASVLFAGVRRGDSNGEESKAVRSAIQAWLNPNDDAFYSALDRANELRNAILNAEVGCYELTTEAEDENVIEIFGRLNQQAVRLTPADLAAARLTGKMRDFRTRAKTALRSPNLKGFVQPEGTERAAQGGFVDTDLIVRTAMCIAKGIVKYGDAEKFEPSKDQLYTKVEPHWDGAVSALHQAVKVFRDAAIPDGSWLPYRYLLLVPAAAYGRGHDRPSDEWLGWAIAASLWGLYSGSAETKAQADARLALDGRWNDLWQSLKNHAKRHETLIPDEEDISAGLVHESGFLLALLTILARNDQRSFLGHRFQAANRPLHVHHIFPRAGFRGEFAARDAAHSPDRLGNLTVLEAGENESLGESDPIEYLTTRVKPDIRDAHQIPKDTALWKRERYTDFCQQREEHLTTVVRDLLKSLGVP